VVTFDNAGVGGSTGATPDTIEQMARDAIAFLAAMQISQADLLGFSIGSFVAQQIALTRPAIVRRLVLASSAPQGAAGMHGWAPEVIGAAAAGWHLRCSWRPADDGRFGTAGPRDRIDGPPRRVRRTGPACRRGPDR
jgi:pimeloyl-ACP methyl ester carboxylesterase